MIKLGLSPFGSQNVLRRVTVMAAVGFSVLSIVSPARAVTDYWENLSGNNTWDTTSVNWSTTPTGTTTPATYTDGTSTDAVFGYSTAQGVTTTTGTITITPSSFANGSGPTMDGIDFSKYSTNGGYTIGNAVGNGTLYIGSGSTNPGVTNVTSTNGVGIYVAYTGVSGGILADTTTINSNIVQNGVQDTSGYFVYTLSANDILTINGNITGDSPNTATGAVGTGTTTGTGTMTIYASHGGTINLNGTISDIGTGTTTNGQLELAGNGISTTTFLLSGTNTYSGLTYISDSTVIADSIGNVGTASALGTGSTAGGAGGNSGGIEINNGGELVLNLSVDSSTNRQVYAIRAVSTISSQGTGVVNFTANNPLENDNATEYIALDSYNGSVSDPNQISGVLESGGTTGAPTHTLSINETGQGYWRLSGSNIYGGATDINGGTLIASTLGTYTTTGGTSNATKSNLGAPNYMAQGTIGLGTLNVSTGTLVDIGTGETSNRNFTLQGNGVIDQSGTGTLNLTGNITGIVSPTSSSTAKILTLQGSTSGLGQVSGAITDAPATVTSEASLNAAIAVGAMTITVDNPAALFTVGSTITGAGIQANTTVTSISGNGVGISLPTNAIITQGQTFTFGGSGTTPTSVVKAGTGTWTLSGSNSYTGATTINGGKLNVTGSTAAASAVQINSGGTLGGTGTAGGTVTMASGGAINLVDGVIGTLTVGGLSTTGGGTMSFEIGGTTTATDNIADTGTLSIAGVTTVDIANLGGTAQTLANNQYLLLSSTGTLTASEFTLGTTTPMDGKALSLSESGGDLYLNVGPNSVPTAYFNGNTSSDLNTASNFYTTPTGSATIGVPVSSATDVYITANTGATGANALTPTLNTGNLTVNSLTFTGTGTPATAGVTLSGTSTLTIAAGTGTYTAGRGITLLTGAGHDTISAPVALGASQTFFVTDSTGTLSVTGNISDGGSAYSLATGGAGTVALSGSNTYSGGTTVAAGTNLAILNAVASPTAHSAGSQTGYGSVAVNGTLSGNGTIAPTTGSGVVVNAGGSFRSGVAGSTATGAYTGAYLNNAANLAKILSVSGTGTGTMSANLTFALGAGSNTLTGAAATPYGEGNPNTDTTYMTVSGSASSATTGNAGEISFSGTDSITLQDLTSGQLTLRQGVPYLLIQAGSTPNTLDDDFLYSGLVTSLDGSTDDLQMDGNGFVIGVGTTSSYTALGINEVDINGNPLTGAAMYKGPVLYLDDGDLEVVPEPSTWAMMIGGLALLVFWQRRKTSSRA